MSIDFTKSLEKRAKGYIYSQKILQLEEKLERENPHSIETLLELAEAYNITKNYPKAIIACEEVNEIRPNEKIAFNNLFYAHDRLENYEIALELLKKYIKIYSFRKIEDLEYLIYTDLLKMYFISNKREIAVELCIPNEYTSIIFDINFSIAFQFSKLGWSKYAIEILEVILKNYPGDFVTLFGLGIKYFEIENYEKARIDFEEAYFLNKENLIIRFYLGETYLKLDLLQEAEKEFIYIIDNEFDSEHRELDQIKHFFPIQKINQAQTRAYHQSAFTELGEIYIKNGEYLEAIENCSEALRLAKEKVLKRDKDSIKKNYMHLGIAYYALNSDDRAIKAFKKVLKIDKNHIKALGGLAEIYFKKKKYRKAMWNLNTIIELNPKDTFAFHLLSKCYYNTGGIEAAQQFNSRCLEINPNYEPAIKFKASLESKSN